MTLRTAALVLLLFSAIGTYSLEVTPNSPCKSKCASGASSGTTENDIVCLDSDFTSTATGAQFQQCVECELGSKAADPKTGTTDVMWALCKSIPGPGRRGSFSDTARQYAIYPLLLHVRLPNPEGLPEQPMSGVMHTTLQRYREWTGSQCDSSRLGILQYGELYKLQYSTVCILLWIDGSAEIPSQLYVPFRCHHTLLLICFTPSPSSPGCCLSGSTLSN